MIFTISSILLAQNKDNSTTKGPYNQLIIRGATLINGNGAPPISPVDITVENDIISGISVIGYPGVPIDENKRPKLRVGGKEINAKGTTILIATHDYTIIKKYSARTIKCTENKVIDINSNTL